MTGCRGRTTPDGRQAIQMSKTLARINSAILIWDPANLITFTGSSTPAYDDGEAVTGEVAPQHHVRTTETVPAPTAGSFHRWLDLLFCRPNCFSERCCLGKVHPATRTHLHGSDVVRVHRVAQGNSHGYRVRGLHGLRGTGGRMVRFEAQSR